MTFSSLYKQQARQMAAQDEALGARVALSGLAKAAELVAVPGKTNSAMYRLSDGSVVPALDFSASRAEPGKVALLSGGVIQTKSGATS